MAQDVYLFSGTIRDNLIYGKPDATEDEMITACRQAGAHDFISALPNGYDTYIGERGLKLSGGQKQRISIARVFLKNPPVLQSLERLAEGRTTLTIAHRLTTVRNADEIVVLTEDGVAEKGTHDELMKKGGVYSKMYGMYSTI